MLTDNVENVQRKNEIAYQQRVEREQAERRHKFYREYANNQLARIITSLMHKTNEEQQLEEHQSRHRTLP